MTRFQYTVYTDVTGFHSDALKLIAARTPNVTVGQTFYGKDGSAYMVFGQFPDIKNCSSMAYDVAQMMRNAGIKVLRLVVTDLIIGEEYQ